MTESERSRGFRELVAWQRADSLASLVFRACHKPGMNSALADQAFRAALSVPANIAEGHGRGTYAEFLRFLDIAKGSLSELEYYIHFMAKERLISDDERTSLESLHAETARVLWGLWRSIKATDKREWDHTGASSRVREDEATYDALLPITSY